MTQFDKYLEQNKDKLNSKCKECFCWDLCLFVLLKAGQVTTCDDWQERVQRVVDREVEKQNKE